MICQYEGNGLDISACACVIVKLKVMRGYSDIDEEELSIVEDE